MSAIKSERYRIKEMELEYALQMQREKLLAEAFLQPPGIYLVGLAGSGLVAYMGALLTPPAKQTQSQKDLIDLGVLKSWFADVGLSTDLISAFKNNTSTLGGLMQMAGGGGAGLFTALLILNEMKPEGGGDQGGVLSTLLGTLI